MATLNLGRVRIEFRGNFEELGGEELVWYDAVTFRGSLYVVVSRDPIKVVVGDSGSHPQNPSFSQYYTQLAEGITYAGTWVQGKKYYKNEIVKYGGSTYIALQMVPIHLDTPQKESIGETGYWVELASGIGKYIPDYDGVMALHNTDMVTWNGTLFMAKQDIPRFENPTTHPEKFEVVAAGFKPAGTWSSLSKYSFRDTVMFHGCQYVVVNELGTLKQPINEITGKVEADWQLMTKGLNYVGIYDPLHNGYYPGDVVTFGRDAYAVFEKTIAGEGPEDAHSMHKYTKIIASSNIRLEELINIDSTNMVNGSLLQFYDGDWVATNHVENNTGDLTISGGEF